MKPREFWIIKEKGYSTWISDKPLYSADTTEEIHVREVLPISEKEYQELLVESWHLERELGPKFQEFYCKFQHIIQEAFMRSASLRKFDE